MPFFLSNLGFLWLFAVPNEQATDWMVEPEGLGKISYLGGLPNESAVEFRNASLVQNGAVSQFPDLDGFPPQHRVVSCQTVCQAPCRARSSANFAAILPCSRLLPEASHAHGQSRKCEKMSLVQSYRSPNGGQNRFCSEVG